MILVARTTFLAGKANSSNFCEGGDIIKKPNKYD